jgi:hypothetical protein
MSRTPGQWIPLLSDAEGIADESAILVERIRKTRLQLPVTFHLENGEEVEIREGYQSKDVTVAVTFKAKREGVSA